jgi:hypothetical protein
MFIFVLSPTRLAHTFHEDKDLLHNVFFPIAGTELVQSKFFLSIWGRDSK